MLVSWYEEFIADIVRELLARRDGAEAVGGHEDLDLGQHLEDDGDAHRQAEDVVAAVGAGHADGADHRLERVGHNGLVGNGQQDVLVHRHHAASDVLATIRVRKQDVDWHVDLAAHAREAGPVAQAVDRQIPDGALGGRRAAAFKCDGHDRLRILIRVVRAAPARGHQTVADERHVHVVDLLLLQAGIVHALHLNTDLFVQAVEHIVPDDAGTSGGVAVLVGVKAHARLRLLVFVYEVLPHAIIVCRARKGVQAQKRRDNRPVRLGPSTAKSCRHGRR